MTESTTLNLDWPLGIEIYYYKKKTTKVTVSTGMFKLKKKSLSIFYLEAY